MLRHSKICFQCFSAAPVFGGSQNGGFQRVVLVDVPLYRHFLQKSFAAVLLWQKKAVIFDNPKNRNKGTFAKTARLSPLGSWISVSFLE